MSGISVNIQTAIGSREPGQEVESLGSLTNEVYYLELFPKQMVFKIYDVVVLRWQLIDEEHLTQDCRTKRKRQVGSFSKTIFREY